MERIAFCINPTFPLLLALLLNKTLLYNKGPLNNFFFFFNWQVDKYRLCHPGLQPLLRVWSYLILALWISAQNMLHNLGSCLINIVLDLEEKNKGMFPFGYLKKGSHTILVDHFSLKP